MSNSGDDGDGPPSLPAVKKIVERKETKTNIFSAVVRDVTLKPVNHARQLSLSLNQRQKKKWNGHKTREADKRNHRLQQRGGGVINKQWSPLARPCTNIFKLQPWLIGKAANKWHETAVEPSPRDEKLNNNGNRTAEIKNSKTQKKKAMWAVSLLPKHHLSDFISLNSCSLKKEEKKKSDQVDEVTHTHTWAHACLHPLVQRCCTLLMIDMALICWCYWAGVRSQWKSGMWAAR